MSYTNGVGSLQQLLGANETAAAASTVKSTEAGSGSGSAAAVNVAGGVDDMKLSSAATVVAQAFAEPDVQTAKVTALQQAIAGGTYNVSSSDVADKLMNALLK